MCMCVCACTLLLGTCAYNCVYKRAWLSTCVWVHVLIITFEKGRLLVFLLAGECSVMMICISAALLLEPATELIRLWL